MEYALIVFDLYGWQPFPWLDSYMSFHITCDVALVHSGSDSVVASQTIYGHNYSYVGVMCIYATCNAHSITLRGEVTCLMSQGWALTQLMRLTKVNYTLYMQCTGHMTTPLLHGANIIWSAISTLACLYWLLGLNIITSLARHRPEVGRQCVQRRQNSCIHTMPYKMAY